MPKVVTIGECEIDIWHDHHLLCTRWPDGLSVTAAANDDPDSIARAHDLGYDGDTWRMSLAHELSHSVLMTHLGYPCSPVLRGVAVREAGGRKEDVVSPDASAWEEGLVMKFQRYLMKGEIDPELAHIEQAIRERSGSLQFVGAIDFVRRFDLEALAAQVREMCA